MTVFLWIVAGLVGLIVAGLVAFIVIVAWGVALGHGFDISDKSIDAYLDNLKREVDEK